MEQNKLNRLVPKNKCSYSYGKDRTDTINIKIAKQLS